MKTKNQSWLTSNAKCGMIVQGGKLDAAVQQALVWRQGVMDNMGCTIGWGCIEWEGSTKGNLAYNACFVFNHERISFKIESI